MPNQAVGSFIATGLERLEYEAAHGRRAPLVTATVLMALDSVPGTAHVKAELAKELRQTATKRWLKDRDLLSVFQVLTALHMYNATAVSGAAMAQALKRLVGCEVEPGGPYASAPGVIEPAANAAIAQFLRCQEVVLPQLEQYLGALIEDANFSTQTMQDEYLQYLLVGVTSIDSQRHLEKTVMAATPLLVKNGSLQELALQLIAIERLDIRSHRVELTTALLDRLRQAGWAAELLYSDILQLQPDDLLTTALVLRALHVNHAPTKQRRPPSQEQRIHEEIQKALQTMLRELPEPLRAGSLEMVERIESIDHDREISLLPLLFADQLRIATPDRQVLIWLGAANVLNWAATIIYDDFIDEEGVPALLPIANTMHRLSLQAYAKAVEDEPELRQYVAGLCEIVDRANAWEVHHARATVAAGSIKLPALPEYGDRQVLAERALGHITGTLLLLRALPDVDKASFDHMEQALRHFLIARQLNDDLHDWRKDLEVGQLSMVVTNLLSEMQMKPGFYTLDVLVSKLEHCFRQTGLQTVCQQIKEHTTQCRSLLAESRLTKPDYMEGSFMRLVNNLEASADDALTIQRQQEEFLKAFNR